ncbi:MAG: hypothetical protein RBQ77_00025 [Candidatus Methanomethylophilaceae archaeon]|jgi:hypothetical protein|nr:hypothetical protein [Candidatus Methanomethylophilaceae archaeon]
MDETLSLRCKYCGAPLGEKDVKSDSPYVTCESCGTTQQRVDAKAYLEQMMGQVKSWISSAMPTGFSMSQAENVDPVARHNIFMNSVRPKVDVETTEYRFAFTSLLAYPMYVLPFTVGEVRPVHTSEKAFEFNAKVKSVEALAVDDSAKALINRAAGISQAYAMMINNTKLLSEDKPGRYTLMANNFGEAARVLGRVEGYGPLCDRLEGLASICTGTETLLGGDVVNSTGQFESGKTKLEAVKAGLFSNPELGVMYQAVEEELGLANILWNVVDILGHGTDMDPLKTLEVIKRVLDIRPATNPQWSFLLNSRSRYLEIFGYVAEALSSKGSGGTITICSGGGAYLMPFWDVDLRYSFTTGALWSKKGVEVTEDLLIPADFVIDPGCLTDATSGITDIFRIRPESGILAGIKGSETSISKGEGITRLSDTASPNSAGSRKVIIPLSTKKEAEKLAEMYLAQRTSRDNKLKLTKPVIKGLMYIPCDMEGGKVRLPADFGALVPERVRRMNASDMLTI